MRVVSAWGAQRGSMLLRVLKQAFSTPRSSISMAIQYRLIVHLFPSPLSGYPLQSLRSLRKYFIRKQPTLGVVFFLSIAFAPLSHEPFYTDQPVDIAREIAWPFKASFVKAVQNLRASYSIACLRTLIL